MNVEYIQNLRYKLQKRVRRLNSVDHRIFHSSLQQFWGFLQRTELIVGVLDDLARQYPSMKDIADRIVSSAEVTVTDDEQENAALSLFVVKKCVESKEDRIESMVGGYYCREGKYNDRLDFFRTVFLDPLYEYVDEQIDDQRAILALLKRYKHKCEWFQREKLFALWQENSQRGEKVLALHLYEYLHDQGLQFLIEPRSASGEVDLIEDQQGTDRLIAEAKIFHPENGRGRSYIVKGFNQIYRYLQDYNEPFGYMIIFNTSDKNLRFAIANQEQSIPFMEHNGKVIFLLAIDIFPHKTSASQRGALETVEITADDLVKIATEEAH
jgi:hypothetical protein